MRLPAVFLSRFAPELTFALEACPSPCDPARDAEISLLREALAMAVADPTLREARASLFIEDIEFVELNTYDRVCALAAQARRQGYEALA